MKTLQDINSSELIKSIEYQNNGSDRSIDGNNPNVASVLNGKEKDAKLNVLETFCQISQPIVNVNKIKMISIRAIQPSNCSTFTCIDRL